MTPKEKAVILVDRYTDETIQYKEIPVEWSFELDKRLALIAVNEMISMLPFTDLTTYIGKWCEQQRNYLNEVKQEIEKL